MSTYTTLCVGGPRDGQWLTVDNRSFLVEEPPKRTFSLADTRAIDEPFKRYRYDIEAIALFGSRVYVALCEDQFDSRQERERAIMRAVLQRDVAAHLEGQ